MDIGRNNSSTGLKNSPGSREDFRKKLAQCLDMPGARKLKKRGHLLDTDGLDHDEVSAIIETARNCKEYSLERRIYLDILQESTVAGVFYEDSTRTKSSFHLATINLGARFINLDVSTSSVKKGETLYDTALTLIAMGTNCLVQRHSASGTCERLAKQVPTGVSIINAGDGWHAHPTQALLDLFTMMEVCQSVQGKRIAIIGDIKHSRVARSNFKLLRNLGADVHVCGPPGLLPPEIEKAGISAHIDIESALRKADFVMALRIQSERMEEGSIPSMADYTKLYRIDHDRLKLANPGAKLLHPGPFNRNVEITSEVADDPAVSLINTQVTNGIAIRMAILYLLLYKEDKQ